MNPVSGVTATDPMGPKERLRQAAHQFEAVFVAQMFREMRSTIDGTGGPTEEMFTSMLDDAMASQAAERSTRGLGEALYRQLVDRLGHPNQRDGAR